MSRRTMNMSEFPPVPILLVFLAFVFPVGVQAEVAPA
jgi:hypothetical protein